MSTPKAVLYNSSLRSLYLGDVGFAYERDYIGSHLILSLGDGLTLQDPSTRQHQTVQSLLIPGGTHLKLDVHGPVAVCRLDDLGLDQLALTDRMQTQHWLNPSAAVYSGLTDARELSQSLETLWHRPGSPVDALGWLNSWAAHARAGQNLACDDRISRVVASIQKNAAENRSVADLAASVNLSVPRLTQLFKRTTGSSIRRFRLWHRAIDCTQRVALGADMQRAALESGFSDYAHFAREFKKMTGKTPSEARNSTALYALDSELV